MRQCKIERHEFYPYKLPYEASSEGGVLEILEPVLLKIVDCGDFYGFPAITII